MRAAPGRLVARHEGPRRDPWALSDPPDDYVRTQARAIVGLELRIVRLEAKADREPVLPTLE
jgi:transcriptional regulator